MRRDGPADVKVLLAGMRVGLLSKGEASMHRMRRGVPDRAKVWIYDVLGRVLESAPDQDGRDAVQGCIEAVRGVRRRYEGVAFDASDEAVV